MVRADIAVVTGSLTGFGIHTLLNMNWDVVGTPTEMAILGALVLLGIILENRLPSAD